MLRAADQCFVCHSALGDEASRLFSRDIHHLKGVPCAGCHGGDASSADMDRAMSTNAGFRGVPKGDDISARCAACHADSAAMARLGSGLPTNQFALLQSSVHGKSSTKGSERIVQCTTCHGAHGIVAPRERTSPVNPLNVVKTCTKCHGDPAYVRAYNPSLPVDQLGKYRTSVHGKRNAAGDVNVAECASCHGSHGILASTDVKSSVYPTNIPATCGRCHSDAAYMKEYRIPTDQYAKYSRSVHGIALLQRNDLGAPACNNCHGNHGATPPGVESISKVCGTCHALNADLFAVSPHKKVFDERRLPECETCHGNHEIVAATEKLLGVSPEAVCSRCHNAQESPAAYGVAMHMRRLTDSLDAAEARAKELVEDAEQKGMEIGEAKYKLRDVRQSRLQARTMVHSLNEDQFGRTVGKGIATATWVAGEAQQAIDEFFFRRRGLGIATLIMTLLASSLYLFIRRLERAQQRGRTASSNSPIS